MSFNHSNLSINGLKFDIIAIIKGMQKYSQVKMIIYFNLPRWFMIEEIRKNIMEGVIVPAVATVAGLVAGTIYIYFLM